MAARRHPSANFSLFFSKKADKRGLTFPKKCGIFSADKL